MCLWCFHDDRRKALSRLYSRALGSNDANGNYWGNVMITFVAVLKTLALFCIGGYLAAYTGHEARERILKGQTKEQLGKLVVTRFLAYVFFVVTMFL